MAAGHIRHAFPPTILSDGVMIIDCHGHYTTEPKDLHRFRKDQTEAVKNKS
ncbi:MAG: 4-oxalmesaconate hydratase, partial [Alphaproteobacteria bacterium]|nr:4-oxalmesaconate hydratase [Alphaproteobacteria bacterium]